MRGAAWPLSPLGQVGIRDLRRLALGYHLGYMGLPSVTRR